MTGAGPRANCWQRVGDPFRKLVIIGAPIRPKGPPIRLSAESDDLFDATIAIGGNHQKLIIRPNDDVVVKLPLLPMVYEIIAIELGQETIESERIRERINVEHAISIRA